ncbi:ankyrin repeat-containing protein [Pyrus ussuriensis x Pyrus communis]|uniref:Ankyrin repeat-containing protein n=1 Tax=Pyrus ussuriensis x Pyrus communis TaxID=2448454 RepID=A0A5N5H9X4_9ROSA|nr:ankyrin repeat-containing protein [Pyrus ussuriensis x Pyrus communis]
MDLFESDFLGVSRIKKFFSKAVDVLESSKAANERSSAPIRGFEILTMFLQKAFAFLSGQVRSLISHQGNQVHHAVQKVLNPRDCGL